MWKERKQGKGYVARYHRFRKWVFLSFGRKARLSHLLESQALVQYYFYSTVILLKITIATIKTNKLKKIKCRKEKKERGKNRKTKTIIKKNKINI